MESSRDGDDAKSVGGTADYRETRRAAIVFWSLALLFVGSRIYLSDQPVPHSALAEAALTSAPVTSLR